MLLFFPLLGGARQSPSLSQLVEEYGDRRAAQTAAALLRDMPTFSPAEQPVAGFLLGNDFAELGLHDLALRQFLALVDSQDLGGAAFLAMARLYDETLDDEALLAQAKHARWDCVRDEDLAEVMVRVARACMRAGRYPEARDDTVPMRGAKPQMLWVPLGSRDDPGSGALAARLGEPAGVWLAEESELFGRCLLLCEALPVAEQYCAMMDGRWIEHGWSRRDTRGGPAGD